MTNILYRLKLKPFAKSQTPGIQVLSTMADLNFCCCCIQSIREHDLILHSFYVKVCAMHLLNDRWIDTTFIFSYENDEVVEDLIFLLENTGFIVSADHEDKILIKPSYEKYDGKRIYCSCECGTLRLFEK